VSSIRIFILGALRERGPMHGHQLRLLFEEERLDLWTDITVGGLYGAIKRLAAEGLIEPVRTEQVGAYPERRVWQITDAGARAGRALPDPGGDPRHAAPGRPAARRDRLAPGAGVAPARTARRREGAEGEERLMPRDRVHAWDLELQNAHHRLERALDRVRVALLAGKRVEAIKPGLRAHFADEERSLNPALQEFRARAGDRGRMLGDV